MTQSFGELLLVSYRCVEPFCFSTYCTVVEAKGVNMPNSDHPVNIMLHRKKGPLCIQTLKGDYMGR